MSDSDPPFAVRTIDHVVIRAVDVEAMIAFWRDVLGCAVERARPDLGLYHLRAGASQVDIVDTDGTLGRAGGGPPAADGRNMDHVCLRIDPFDGDALAAHLRAHGIAVGEVTRRFGAEGEGPSLYVEAPEGTIVELKGPPEDAG
jgi:catechol 2,3-dioxygenase-like lactoylglutathione lyase family enzyme